jgi:hypothetical protein
MESNTSVGTKFMADSVMRYEPKRSKLKLLTGCPAGYKIKDKVSCGMSNKYIPSYFIHLNYA